MPHVHLSRTEFCDARLFFTCAGESAERVVEVHRAVLCAIPYFGAFFRQTEPFAVGRFFDYRMAHVQFDADVFARLIESAYGDETKPCDAGQWLAAADYFSLGEEKSKKYVIEYLEEILRSGNGEIACADQILGVLLGALRHGSLSSRFKETLLERFYDCLTGEQREVLVRESGEVMVSGERLRVRTYDEPPQLVFAQLGFETEVVDLRYRAFVHTNGDQIELALSCCFTDEDFDADPPRFFADRPGRKALIRLQLFDAAHGLFWNEQICVDGESEIELPSTIVKAGSDLNRRSLYYAMTLPAESHSCLAGQFRIEFLPPPPAMSVAETGIE